MESRQTQTESEVRLVFHLGSGRDARKAADRSPGGARAERVCGVALWKQRASVSFLGAGGTPAKPQTEALKGRERSGSAAWRS